MAIPANQSILGHVTKVLTEKYGRANVFYVPKTDTARILSTVASREFRIAELKKLEGVLRRAFPGKPGDKPPTYYPAPRGKTGEIRYAGLTIVMKSKEWIQPALKPTDITPSIVNKWLTPNEMVKNVLTYINNADGFDKKFQEKLVKLVKDTENSQGLTVQYEHGGDKVQSEFFEVLTAIKLSVLLRAGDHKMKQVLGIPKTRDLSHAKIKIYLPVKSNFPLVDYELSVSASENKTGEKPIRISVKSKVESPRTNTVKFPDTFSNVQEVDKWYSRVPAGAMKKEQEVPMITARAALETKASGNLGMYPIRVMNKLIKRSEMQRLIRAEFLPKKIQSLDFFKVALSKADTYFGALTRKTSLGGAPFTFDTEQREYLNAFMVNVLRANKAPGFTAENLAITCDKILMRATNETLKAPGYNFYQLFYDQVLLDREIAYAVADLPKGGSKTLKYSFYSKVNFAKEYKDWIGLRTKNSADQLNDSLGMDV